MTESLYLKKWTHTHTPPLPPDGNVILGGFFFKFRDYCLVSGSFRLVLSPAT